jgi:hypothetical protein
MFAVLASFVLSVPADIKLNQPDLNRGLIYSQTLSKRHSERTFSSTSLSLQDLSDLFWSVGGINRPSSSLLVNPTATNAQDISVYAVLPQGIYAYDKKAHYLRGLVDGDYRSVVATSEQPSVANAPVIVLIASDTSTFTGISQDEKIRWSALDSGIATQTALLWASANGYVAVPRAIMDTQTLGKLIGLSATQILELNVPVGHPSG